MVLIHKGKVNRRGAHDSLFVTVPKNWARAQGIEAADPVELYANEDGHLIMVFGETAEEPVPERRRRVFTDKD
jgi:bifunctional DNA-binding transcriptional regulator/antitoxin component of YhaV-PrlF toxin-antitoxin module